MKTKEQKKVAKGGQPTKYNNDIHIDLLLELFTKGEGVMGFCATAHISKRTFYGWLETHKEFKEAYEIAICKAGAWWEKYPHVTPDFNASHWSIVMRNRFGYGKSRIRKPKENTPVARMDALWKGLENGEIGAQEANNLSSVVVTHNNIATNAEVEAEFKLDTKEEIMAKVAAIRELIDYKKKTLGDK